MVFVPKPGKPLSQAKSLRPISLMSFVLKTKKLMLNKEPTRCHLVLYIFLLYKLFNRFRATLCQSSGDDDLVVFLPLVV